MKQSDGRISMSGSTVKLIALAAMFTDHFAAVFVSRLINSGAAEAVNPLLTRIYIYMRAIGRIAFPLFVFLLIEGVIHTRSKWKYLGRMALFAVISEIPFDLAFNVNRYNVRRGRILEFSYQNVFFTLAIGLLVVIIIEYLWKSISFSPKAVENLGEPAHKAVKNLGEPAPGAAQNLRGAVSEGKLVRAAQNAVKFCLSAVVSAAGIALSIFLKTDYSGIGVLAVVIMYAFRKKRCFGAAAVSLVLSVYSLIELPAFLSVIPVYFYNGSRGRNVKWLFYIFYPAHLLVLWCVCMLLGIVS